LLEVFDEASEVDAASALRCVSELAGQEGKHLSADRLSVGGGFGRPQDFGDRDEDLKAG
jgi:hypothetical protein